MSEPQKPLTPDRIRNDAVWYRTKVLFIAAGLFFLLNIAIGFVNAVTSGAIPHWQILTHLHAAALGWITLGAIAFAIWIVTGERSVTDTYVTAVRRLAWLSILFFAGYVLSFSVAFSQGGATWLLLPVFGTGAMVIVWAVTGYVLSQLRHQPAVSSAHVLLASALLVASLGAAMGVLLGLQYATGVGIADVGAHAPVMFFYVILLGSAIVDWVTVGAADRRWTRTGVVQAAALIVAAVVMLLVVLGGFEMLGPLVLLMLAVFLILFVYRVGWRALRVNPLTGGVRAWTFFGAVWLIIVVLSFPLEIVLQPNIPEWLFPVLAHATFVGMATNLLFGVLSVRTRASTDPVSWGEPAALWVMNLGIVLFVALRITQGTRHGAIVMGLGVLFGVLLMLNRLLSSAPAGRQG